MKRSAFKKFHDPQSTSIILNKVLLTSSSLQRNIMVSLLMHSSILLVLAFQVCSWSNNSIVSIRNNRFSLMNSIESKESEIHVDEKDIQPKVEYGVSYIGGDPCGSKYNTDPFDVKVTKPGMPDDMKSRIQVLANKKIRAMKEERDKEEQ